MQTSLGLQCVLRFCHATDPGTRFARAAKQAREVEDGASERQQLIFCNSARVALVVRRMARDPWRLVIDAEDAGATQLKIAGAGVGMAFVVEGCQEGALALALEGEGDKD